MWWSALGLEVNEVSAGQDSWELPKGGLRLMRGNRAHRCVESDLDALTVALAKEPRG